MKLYSFYLLFAIIACVMSIIDCTFTYWYLRKLVSKGMPNVHGRELNPLARFYMKRLGFGWVSLVISITSAQLILWVCFSIFPQFGLMMYGALSAVFVYHLAIYKEVKKFDNDKKYWLLVKYKLSKAGVKK